MDHSSPILCPGVSAISRPAGRNLALPPAVQFLSRLSNSGIHEGGIRIAHPWETTLPTGLGACVLS